jgi:hypothetical protein
MVPNPVLYCTQCGAQIGALNARFCQSCGGLIASSDAGSPRPQVPLPVVGTGTARVAEPRPEPRSSPPPAPQYSSPGQSILGWVLLVGLIVGIGWWFIGASDKPSPSGDWPAAAEANFVASCIDSGGTSEECACYLSEMQQRVSFDEFVVIERELLDSGKAPEVAVSAAASCISSDLGAEEAVPPTAPRVTSPQLTGEEALRLREELLRFRDEFMRFEVDVFRWETVNTEHSFGEVLCFIFSYTNTGRTDGFPSALHFSLVGPTGQVMTHWFLPERVMPVPIIPGASATADVCFLSASQRGTFTLRYRPFDEQLGSWTVDVS